MPDKDIDPRERPGMKAALTNLRAARRGKPTEADRPPVGSFPMTPAARAAIELGKKARKPFGV